MQKKDINPFINRLVVPYIEYVKELPSSSLYDSQPTDSFKVEATRFSRLYVSKDNREFIFQKLSRYGRELLMAIQYFTNQDYQYVILTHDKMVALLGNHQPYSERKFEDTIRELIRYTIVDIKDRKKGEYWYNPYIFCPGNRITLFPECAVKKETVYIKPKNK